jgi:hypothetical protein
VRGVVFLGVFVSGSRFKLQDSVVFAGWSRRRGPLSSTGRQFRALLRYRGIKSHLLKLINTKWRLQIQSHSHTGMSLGTWLCGSGESDDVLSNSMSVALKPPSSLSSPFCGHRIWRR